MRTLISIGLLLNLACSSAREGRGGSGQYGSGGGGSESRDDAGEGEAGDAGSGPASEGGEGSASTGASGGSASADSGGGEISGGGVDDGGARLDVGGSASASAGEGGEGGSQGCQKLDLLFVIDNSTSMAAEQERLVAAFPGFFDQLVATLGADVRLAVVSTDADLTFAPTTLEPTCAADNCACMDPEGCCAAVCTENDATTCFGLPCSLRSDFDDCDLTFGAGRRFSAAGAACTLPPDRRYFTAGEPMANEVFACVADVGLYGQGNEAPIEALRAALSPGLLEAGGCNEGVVRDDALLGIVVLTDEEDNAKSRDDPEQWYEAVLAIKDGIPEAVVALGLIGDGDVDDGECGPLIDDAGAEPSPRLREFFERFGSATTASICLEDYGPVLATWLDSLTTACDAFVAPG